MATNMMREPVGGTRAASILSAIGIAAIPSVLSSMTVVASTNAKIITPVAVHIVFSVFFYIVFAFMPFFVHELREMKLLNTGFFYYAILMYLYQTQLLYADANNVGSFVVALILWLSLFFLFRPLNLVSRPGWFTLALVTLVYQTYFVIAAGLAAFST